MKDIKCTIIQDVLPLYIDKVVSQDTKEMVDEHLQHCAKCQKEYEAMKHELYIPIENKVSLLSDLSRKWRKKKVMISIASVLITITILIGVYAYVFVYDTVIPYSENLFKIEKQDDNRLASHYYGKSHAGLKATHPLLLEVDGVKKNVIFIFYTQTIADSPSRKLFNNRENKEQGYTFTFGLDESQDVDAVYYVEYDVKKIIAEKDSWDSVLERATLIWIK
ncbi:zf-HC2 domain-containing protein [Cytobacillus sp. IB215665]|uniref:zf-HC2 domain-containing protein n=1 Tax=Cytobacillus sp. IB215665 TaxID=3097357 RepID=UPI002A0D9250|nr:zf-HC2 domain-containing protein [Cytobacillus sp. IB215665]MDX8365534.1 zf-HC2 domain-containing protein [Cytobacillus sp. IB215665]